MGASEFWLCLRLRTNPVEACVDVAPMSPVQQFSHDETGTVMAETVIVLAMLLWSFLAMFVYWDSFRATNTVEKPSYTISDIISREMQVLPTTYFDGMKRVANLLIDSDQDIKLRVTSITYKQAALEYQVLWSYSPGAAMEELTTSKLPDLKSRSPAMSDADYATIVEIEMPYLPAFNIGMNAMPFRQFIITRPRFVAPTCLSGRACT